MEYLCPWLADFIHPNSNLLFFPLSPLSFQTLVLAQMEEREGEDRHKVKAGTFPLPFFQNVSNRRSQWAERTIFLRIRDSSSKKHFFFPPLPPPFHCRHL